MVLRQAILERRHWPAAFGDLIENLAVLDRGHALRVGEVGGKRVMTARFRAVALAAFPMTLRAFIFVNLPGGPHVRFRGQERIHEALVLRRDNPRFVLLDQPSNDEKANDQEQDGKEQFAKPQGERLVD